MMISQLIASTRRLISDEKGVTALEYGVIAAAIVTVLVAVMPGVSGGLTSTFNGIAGAL